MRETELRGHGMKWRRILGLVAVFLAMNGSSLGSEPEKRRQVRWSELKKLIGGKQVTLQLAEGARVEGRIRTMTAASLVFKVKKSSDPVAYPKGKIQVPRETVSRIEVRGLKENKGMRVGATVGTFVGAMMGSMVAIAGTEAGEPGEKFYGSYAASIAIATGVAILVNRALRPKDLTLIKILPDSPGKTAPKPTNKDESSNTTASGEALPPALFVESSSERLRLQARRALMRQGIPLHLSSLPVHGAHKSID